MVDPALIKSYLRELEPEQLHQALTSVLPANATAAARAGAIEDVLRSRAGRLLRDKMGKWIVEKLVPVEALVPQAYAQWRPPVRDAMLFVVSHLSAARLAPKLLEQLELPPKTRPEERLLRLIAKVPGLQKLGQVLARNRHLRPSMREALSELENGIHDVKAEDVRAIIQHELGPRLQSHAVVIKAKLLSEASVSAVMPFTWRDGGSRRRQRGVFKVLKPHIPLCFAEDMEMLQGLAEFFGSRYREYGMGPHVLTDTFTKVRRLLQHEVDFPREQATLLEAYPLYRSVAGVRVPRLIQPLCTPTITAITEEHGVKVTDAAARIPAWRRGQVARQLIEALVAIPLFAAEQDAMFHADPHAGNLLYNGHTGELVLLDWALTERLSRGLRRHLALLFLMMSLRDAVGVCEQIQALSQRRVRHNLRRARVIRATVDRFLGELPLARLPGGVDAMRLLERMAVKGIRVPAALIMFSKVLFTLDGILQDIGGGVSMDLTIGRHLVYRWLTSRAAFGSPLTLRDWIAVQCSAMLYSSRMFVQSEQKMLDRWLPARSGVLAQARRGA